MCEECRINIEKLEKATIKKYKCGEFNFDEHIYLFKYEDLIRKQLISYKFNDKPYYYQTFSNILIKNKKIYEILNSYDIITPVPIHNKRRKERGYNQTELIAKKLAKSIENLEYKNILIKRENTVPQSTLNKKQRIENAKNMYTLNKIIQEQEIQQKNILIFDDIFTTGSTANECAKVLKILHPKKIGILTIAKDFIKK